MQWITDQAIVRELGRRIAALREARILTQGELANRAGVGRSTVQRIERGDSIQLSSLVKLLRELDRLDALDALLPSEPRSPLADLERERSRHRRVRHRADASRPADARQRPWQWGDEER